MFLPVSCFLALSQGGLEPDREMRKNQKPRSLWLLIIALLDVRRLEGAFIDLNPVGHGSYRPRRCASEPIAGV